MNMSFQKILISAVFFALFTIHSVGAMSVEENNPRWADTNKQDEVLALKELGVGQRANLENISLEGVSQPVILELKRFEVFSPGAIVTVHHDNGEEEVITPPAAIYFQGNIQGDPSSIAVVSLQPTGEVHGIIQQGDYLWSLSGGNQPTQGTWQGITTTEIKQSGKLNSGKPFLCDVDKLPAALQAPKLFSQAFLTPEALPAGQIYAVNVAIETDYEFYQLFGNTTAALSYIGNLFAYGSTIYQRDIQSKLVVKYVSLWSTSSDPWGTWASTLDGLNAFQTYWNANRTSVARATAHFLSGRSLGGGIAYIGVLCNSTYGYGFSANIDKGFNISSPTPDWDIVVTTHEIGHNFDSLHSHDYQNIPNSSYPSAIDFCWNDSTGTATGILPGIGSLSGGTPGTGTGTIMSYCNQNYPGMTNIGLTFGKGFIYGVQAYRESDLMSNYVASVATSYPSCIPIDTSAGLAGAASNGTIWYTTNLLTWTNSPGLLTQVSAGDINGDGHADLAGVASNGTIWYTTNLSTWTRVPGLLAQVSVGDINGDGLADLVGAASNGTIWYTTNLSTWTNVPGLLTQVSAGDINGDGHADLVGAASNGTIWYTTNLSTWTNPPGLLAQVSAGDINGDGLADLVGAASNGTIWYTTNLSTWTNVPGLLTQVSAGDINGDGHADLAGGASNGTIWYTTNLSTWTNPPSLLKQVTIGKF